MSNISQNFLLQENVDMNPFTTFRMGPLARYLFVISELEDLQIAFSFAQNAGLPVFILGSGSNILMSDVGVLEAVVLKIELAGFGVVSETAEKTIIKIGSGEIWDEAVKRTVEMNLWGIEALSAIPGTAGATPIQNVGAYGSEIADVLVSLEAYDIATGQIKTLAKSECKFTYRNSIFKDEAKDKYVITSITIELSKIPSTMPDYPGVKKYFEEKGITAPTLQQIRQAIIEIRSLKLPDPKIIASVGSFFKNPFVSKKFYEQLKTKYADVVAFPLENGDYKISAGWLLETLGVKGKQFGQLQFYPHNALVLTNLGGATYAELENLIENIKEQTQQTFGIDLELEPITVLT